MKRPRGKMEPGLFYKIIDEIAGKNITKNIALHIMGEPLLHPGIFDFINYSRKKKLCVGLMTNGMLLDKYSGELIKADIDTGISLQTPTPETFNKRNAGISFDDYLSGIFRFIEKKIVANTSSRLDLHIMNTKYKKPGCDICSNEKDARYFLEKVYGFANDLIDKMPLDFPKNVLSESDEFLGIERLKKGIGDSSYKEFLPGITVLFKYGINWNNLMKEKKYPSKKAFCSVSLRNNFDWFGIYWDGRTTFCCSDHDAGLSMGNVSEVSLEEIIDSQKYKQIREQMKKGNLPLKTCQNCLGADNVLEAMGRKLLYYYRKLGMKS